MTGLEWLGSSGLIAAVMVLILAVVLAIGFAGLWLAWKRRQDAKAGYPAKDERTSLQEGRAAYYTVFISMYLMLALLWYNFLGENLFDLPALDLAQILITLVLVMAGLFAGFRWHFLRQGETA